MIVYLECWYFGRRTILLEVKGVGGDWTINDLICRYHAQVIKPSTVMLTWEFCSPKMQLCDKNDVIYTDKSKTLAELGIHTNCAFTVLCGFNY